MLCADTCVEPPAHLTATAALLATETLPGLVLNTICFLVYGSKREYQLELTYSAASVHRFAGISAPEEWRIVLICDAANRRNDLPVEHLEFSPEEFAEWTDNGRYHHAAKVHALIKAVGRFGNKIALVDTDTYFIQHPSALFEKIGKTRTVMQARDGILGQFAEWQHLIETTRGECLGFAVDSTSDMLNSGVVGIHEGDAPLLPEVLSLMNTLYHLDPVFNIEQFAFSAVLGKHTELTICPNIVSHYWGHERHFMHAHIGALFPEFDRDRFDRLTNSFTVFGYPQKKLMDMIKARLQTLWRRQDGDYGFACLAYQSALSNASSNPLEANAWARIAADILLRRGFPADMVDKDFKQMRNKNSAKWLSAEATAAWAKVWHAKTDAGRGAPPAH